MHCPGCGSAMKRLAVDGHGGTSVEIDLCMGCRAFWFDTFEDLHLTPAATLKLFAMIAGQSAAGTPALAKVCFCPKCSTRLVLTHDRQRNTPFQYWRCDRGHGKFTPFVDFLREKDFICPLSPQQITELRENIQMVHCSNCGAPIDLTKASACPHCGSPLSMLDMKKMLETARHLEKASHPATVPPRFANDEGQAAALFAKLKADAATRQATSPFGLVEAGLEAVAEWLHELIG
ncbi:MAG TPA: zf-TFIIB domain-containing protein [Thermoanaerobaculia bacterium]|nr:zf-TFIIB domain-containing protein [Thermoanaerobaculia bacterium]